MDCFAVSSTFTISEAVVPVCEIKPGRFDFGRNTEMMTTIRVDCSTAGIPITIKLNGGTHLSSDHNYRQLMDLTGKHPLKYNLYQDANHNNILGDNGVTMNKNAIAAVTQNGGEYNFTVYGKILDNVTGLGDYSDNIEITVEY